MDVIIHFDEIFLKGKNQKLFINKLAENIRRLFSGVNVNRIEGGFIVKNISTDKIKQLSLIPGVATLAEVVKCSSALSAIKKNLENIVIPNEVKTFRITASRSDKSYPLNSDEINRQLGAVICKKYNLKVGLKKPDFIIRVDISSSGAYIYHQMIKGIGGLPVGTAGRILCLISGGFDSPVAAYEIMKRGGEVGLIHFQNETMVKDDVREKILDLAKILNQYQPKIDLYIIPFGDIQKELIMKIPSDFRMIISRRIMYKIAEKIALKNKYYALASGDSLGQVASQTLENISVVYQSAQLLKLSPLITRNKSEIMDIATTIGTYEISKRPYHDCCSFISSKHPKTKSHISEILRLESYLNQDLLDKIKPISYHIGSN